MTSRSPHKIDFVVYKITNKINGKIYVGKCRYGFKHRWTSHVRDSKIKQTPLYRAMRKYGLESFTIEAIEKYTSQKDMDEREAFWIEYLDCMNTNVGYNMMSDVQVRRVLTEEERIKRAHSMQKHKFIKEGKYTGVNKSYDRERPKPWMFSIKYCDNIYRKRFKTAVEAAEAYDKMALFLFGDDCLLNFPKKKAHYIQEGLSKFFDEVVLSSKESSEFYGVSLSGQTKEYRATITDHLNKYIYLGEYKTELEAAIVHDKVSFYLFSKNGPLNFPEGWDMSYITEGEQIYKFYTQENRDQKRKVPRASKYRYVSRKGANWETSFILNYKRYRTDTIFSEEEAAIAADEITVTLLGEAARTNFPIENYKINGELQKYPLPEPKIMPVQSRKLTKQA